MKTSFPIVGLTLFAGLLVAVGYWTWTVTHTFAVSDPWWRSLPYYLFYTFQSHDLRPVAFWSMLKGFGPAFFLLYMLNALDDTDRSLRFLRGARIVGDKELAGMTKAKPSAPQIEIAGVPMPLACEPNHLLLAGNTNTGKSTASMR